MRQSAPEMGALTVSAADRGDRASTSSTGASRGVRTDKGDIQAEVVVIACGVWSPRIARMAGASIPLTPAVHQMIDVGPVPHLRAHRRRGRLPDRPRHGHVHVRAPARRPASRSAPTRTGRSSWSPTTSPRSRRRRSPRRAAVHQGDFDPQLEDALELFPEIARRRAGRDQLRDQWAPVADAGRQPDPGRDTGGQGPLVGRGDLDQGSARHRQDRRRVDDPRRRPRSTPMAPTSRASTRHHRPRRTSRRARPRASTRPTASSTPASSGLSNRDVRLTPCTSASASSARSSSRPPAGSGRMWYESNEPLLETTPTGSCPAKHEWDARWWSPIINAEHLAMRERVGPRRPLGLRHLRRQRPGALGYLQGLVVGQMDVPVGRVVYTPLAQRGRRHRRRPDDHAARPSSASGS